MLLFKQLFTIFKVCCSIYVIQFLITISNLLGTIPGSGYYPHDHQLDQHLQLQYVYSTGHWEALLKGRLSTVDLHIKMACFVENLKYIFTFKSS
jgi:hypothetical protein